MSIRIQRDKAVIAGVELWPGALLELEVDTSSSASRIPGAPMGTVGGPPRASFPSSGNPQPPTASELASIVPARLDVIPADVEALLPPPMAKGVLPTPAPPAPPSPGGVFAHPTPFTVSTPPPAPKLTVVGHYQEGTPHRIVADGRTYPLTDGAHARLVESRAASDDRYLVSYHVLTNETRVPRQQGRALGPVHVFDYKSPAAWKKGYLHFQGTKLWVAYPEIRRGQVEFRQEYVQTGWRIDLKGAQQGTWEEIKADLVSAIPLPPPPPPPPPPPSEAPPELISDEASLQHVRALLEERAKAHEADEEVAALASAAIGAWVAAWTALNTPEPAPELKPHTQSAAEALAPHKNREVQVLIPYDNRTQEQPSE